MFRHSVPGGTLCLSMVYPPEGGRYSVPSHRVPGGTLCLGMVYPLKGGTYCLRTVYRGVHGV